MGRLEVYGRRDSLLPAMAAAVFPSRAVTLLDADDPFANLGDDAPDLLLVDLSAGTWQGEALVSTVRLRHPHCPVVAVHDGKDRELRAKIIAAGADIVLEEPFGLDEFRNILERRLGQDHSRHESRPSTPAKDSLSPNSTDEDPEPPEEDSIELDALAVFVRGLAHEINNPLTTIRGFLQLLLSDAGKRKKEDSLEAYRTMERESRRVAELVEELEFFSGTRRPARTPVDFTALVGTTLKERGLTDIQANVHDDRGPVLVDRDQVSRALNNILGFLATEAAENPSSLSLDIIFSDQGVRLKIASRLQQNTPEPPTRLLVPLYGGRHTEKHRQQSLASAFGIARAHGGDLTVQQNGAGVIFELILPTPAISAEE